MKKILITLAVIIISIFFYVLYIFYSTGFFRDIENTFNGAIERRIQIPGVEDLQISYEDHFILLSSDDRASRRNGANVQGHLYRIELTDTSFKPVQLTSDFNSSFFPHGLSMIRVAPGIHKVFVINHVSGKHSIEVFELYKDSLAHVETLRHHSMISPNDVVAIDENRFYFTNDHGYTEGLGKLG